MFCFLLMQKHPNRLRAIKNILHPLLAEREDSVCLEIYHLSNSVIIFSASILGLSALAW